MKTLACPHCAKSFEFDFKKIWTSPGPQLNHVPEHTFVIPCPNCKKTMSFKARESQEEPKGKAGK